LYQFSPLKKVRIKLLEKLVIPAEAGIQILDSRFHGNDNLNETTEESFQRVKVLQFFLFYSHCLRGLKVYFLIFYTYLKDKKILYEEVRE